MGLNWNFQRGVEIQTKKPSMGGVWIFSGTTQYQSMCTIHPKNCKLLVLAGTAAYDKLKSLLTSKQLLKDIEKLSSDAQTSCLEGFHSTLNHWHPKMIGFSWLGTFCRCKSIMWVTINFFIIVINTCKLSCS